MYQLGTCDERILNRTFDVLNTNSFKAKLSSTTPIKKNELFDKTRRGLLNWNLNRRAKLWKVQVVDDESFITKGWNGESLPVHQGLSSKDH